MKSILLTGVGVVSPAGVGTAFLPKPEGLNDWGDLKLPDLNPDDYGWRGLHRQSRIGKYCSLAIGEAFRSADWAMPIENSELSDKTGLIISTSHSNLDPIIALYEDAQSYGVNHVNPGIFPDTVLNAIGGHASIYFRITGPNATLSNGRMSGPMGLLYAYDLLTSGQADYVMCCAIEVHPPSRLRSVADVSSGPESVVALLFQRDDVLLPPVVPERAVRVTLQGPHAYMSDESLLIKPSNCFLALASLYHARMEPRRPSVIQPFVTRQANGYYMFSLDPVDSIGEGHG
ncbi:beta-ketoacyl synthase N-terminal-like domain-containing protein [Cohnella soli]|uniref:Beta-ketoacyl synthase N-terminal-like domain-containing protein n=1 Tax=Cohnella soli TaxID=425005 RepID=A0ABW0I5A6_9BACL